MECWNNGILEFCLEIAVVSYVLPFFIKLLTVPAGREQLLDVVDITLLRGP
jgi:hypothetical protein